VTDAQRQGRAIEQERNRQFARIADALDRSTAPKPKTRWDHFKDRL
jgi:hypothetical protein